MALSGSFYSYPVNPSYGSFGLYCEWSGKQSIIENYTDVTLTVYIRYYNLSVGAKTDSTVSINGVSETYTSPAINNYPAKDVYHHIKTYTVKVYHKDDGTMPSCELKASWSFNGNYAGTYVGTITASTTVALDPIARLSVPTVSATSVTMGKTVTIYTNRKSTDLKHTFTYTFGSITKEEKMKDATGIGDSYTWTVPDLAAACNDALSGTCTIYCHTYIGGTYLGTKPTTLTLTVPDASVPTLSASTVEMGNSLTIYTNRKSTNFKHKISYSFNGETVDLDTDATASYKWTTVPYSLAEKIPSATSGTVTITCTTYNGTAKVGTAKTVTFTATVPDNSTTKPSISGLTLTPSHIDGYPHLKSYFPDIYVQGLTRVRATYIVDTPYSGFKSVTMTVKDSSGKVLSSESRSYPVDTSATINAVGDVTVTVTVTNTRGQTNSSSKTISFYEYSKPELLLCETDVKDSLMRCNDSGEVTSSGLYLKICAGRKKWSPLNGKNYCDLKYRYKVFDGLPLKGEEWITLLDSSDAENEFNGVATVDGNPSSAKLELYAGKSYLVEIQVIDTVGNYETFTKIILTCEATFMLKNGGKGASFGKYPEVDDLLDVAWNGRVMKDLQVLGTLTAGHIGGIGTYDGKDFDELVYNTGYYVSASAPDAVGCSNFPINTTGVLEVISNMYQNQNTKERLVFAYQTYRTHDGEFYTRSYYSEKEPQWSNWMKHSGVAVV